MSAGRALGDKVPGEEDRVGVSLQKELDVPFTDARLLEGGFREAEMRNEGQKLSLDSVEVCRHFRRVDGGVVDVDPGAPRKNAGEEGHLLGKTRNK